MSQIKADLEDEFIDDQVIITSKNKVRRAYWKVKETIGVAIINTRGVSKGSKSVIIGK